MIDINNLLDPGSHEVLWDYCLEQNIIMPSDGPPVTNHNTRYYNSVLRPVSGSGCGSRVGFADAARSRPGDYFLYSNAVSVSWSGSNGCLNSIINQPW